jgi:hypothetical protein
MARWLRKRLFIGIIYCIGLLTICMIFNVDLGTAQQKYWLLNIICIMPAVLLIRWRYPALYVWLGFTIK